MSAFTEANRKAFDDLASTYNSKAYQVRISQQVSEALQQRKSWLGAQWLPADSATPSDQEHDATREVLLLDYACGTGAVTKALGGYVSTIRGIDISENMVKLYNEAARSSGLSVEQANAVVGDLLGAEVPAELSGSEWYGFDVAAIGLGFHHFEDPPLAVKRLAERLKPETGVLVIVDFLPFEQRSGNVHDHGHGHEHGHSHEQQNQNTTAPSTAHTIKHHGFTSQGIKRLFDAAGLEDFAFDVLPEPAVFDFPEGRKERTIFIAKGRKSPTVWGKLKGWVGGLQDAVGGQMALKADEKAAVGGFAPRRDQV
ncbi:hypothetical protein Q7P37_001951 [Cladosporium fusiforme]